MSIINDALKKVQSQRLKTKSIISDERIFVPEKGKNTFLITTITLLFAGFVIAGSVFIAVLTNARQRLSSRTEKTQTISLSSLEKRTFFARQAGNPSVQTAAWPKDSTLNLNGIMKTDGVPLALINNKIRKVGDYIGRKKILRIFLDRVEILDNGRVIELKLRED